MHKLLPFRQYDEKDVINLFRLNLTGEASPYTNLKPGGTTWKSAGNWSGTAVKAGSNGDKLGSDEPAMTQDEYLGRIGTNDQGFALTQGSFYPNAPMSIDVSDTTDDYLGISLRPTMAWDENGEKLLYYNVKKDEFQAVLPGEAVPVATRGFFTMKQSDGGAAGCAISGAVSVGDHLKVISDGRFSAYGAEETDEGFAASVTTPTPGGGHVHGSDQRVVGIVLATGTNGGEDVALVQLGIR